jgi:hypothetical protein
MASSTHAAPTHASPTHVVVQASHALRQSLHPAIRHLRVESDERALIISGRVTSYYLKQLAQETIMPVRGELELVNRVAVEKKALQPA